MSGLVLLVIFFLNFAISCFNAWGCGKTWAETKHIGGVGHFMNWMGAVMSASGFTWCYLVIIVMFGSVIPITDDTTGVTAPAIDQETLQAVFELGYMVIIFPILGSGLAITIQTWAVFWRRRTFANAALTGWNTFAQVHNMYSAARHIPGIWSNLGAFFGKSSDSGDGKGKLVILLVVVAVGGGILTTAFIIKTTMRNHMYAMEGRIDHLQRMDRMRQSV